MRETREALRLQAAGGAPVSDDALDHIVHRAAVPLIERFAEYPPVVVAALLPSIVRRLLLAMVASGEDAP